MFIKLIDNIRSLTTFSKIVSDSLNQYISNSGKSFGGSTIKKEVQWSEEIVLVYWRSL